MTFRVAVLASGSGSNFEALTEALKSSTAATVKLLICNVLGAGVISRATRLGVHVEVLEHQAFATRISFDEAIAKKLVEHRIDLVCLAGYMRIVGPTLAAQFKGRLINIHPALLPSFPGLHAARQAVEKRVKISGCTVHYVDEGIDTGPIIAQRAVAVFANDTPETLAARILEAEHTLYPKVVLGIASGNIFLTPNGVVCQENIE